MRGSLVRGVLFGLAALCTSVPRHLPHLSLFAAGACERVVVAAAAAPTAIPTSRTNGRPANATIDRAALDEMLRGSKGYIEHWTQSPELLVLTSVMAYQTGETTEYSATGEELTNDEVASIVTDLTGALALLTGNAFDQFAAIHREAVLAGARASILRPRQIVVGRYRGVRTQLNDIGLGGRSSRTDGTIIGGTIVLDSEYDRTSSIRRLLRTHELGHALGYNHVQSRPSIMNPRIGSEPTEFDREAALVAFHGFRIRVSE